MTYDELMEKVRDRGKAILSNNTNWDTGTVFDAINASARWLMSKTKAKEATATLTIVSGTRDYTISSAIASDVDTINMVVIDTNEIHGVSLKKLQDEIQIASGRKTATRYNMSANDAKNAMASALGDVLTVNKTIVLKAIGEQIED